MLDLLESLADHSRPGTKLFTPADEFLKDMISLMGVKEFAGRSGQSEGHIQRQLKRLKGRIVYTDPGHEEVLSFLQKGAKAPKINTKETPGASAPTDGPKEVEDGAIMQFQNILTSKSQDRDGDILNPMGANIDQKCPLLWQHMPWEPCGKLVKVLSKTEENVATECAIADIPLGRDAAVLVEFGGLRISHGFVPIDYDQRKDANGNTLPGWDIETYNVLEISLVSIPSNPDAVITAFSRSKLFHPLTKGWGEALFRKRTVMANGATILTAQAEAIPSKEGFTVNVNVNLENAATKAAAATQTPPEAALTATEAPATTATATTPATTPTTKAAATVTKADDETESGTEGTAETAGDSEGDSEGSEGGDSGAKPEGEEGSKAGTGALAEVCSLVKNLGESNDMPQEAKDRLATAGNMLASVDAAVAESGDKYKAAADSRDITEMLLTAQATVDTILAGVRGASDEIERAAKVDGLTEDQQAGIDDAADRVASLWTEVAAAAGVAPEEEEGEEGEEAGYEEDKEGVDPNDEEFEPAETMPEASFESAINKLHELAIVIGFDDDQKAQVKDLAAAI